MASILCSECIADTHLKAIVGSEGEEDHCEVCDNDRPFTITVDRLGQLVTTVIEKYFEPVEGDYLDTEAKYLGDLVKHVLSEQRFAFHDHLVDAVLSFGRRESRTDALPVFNLTAKYVEKRAAPYGVWARWERVKNELRTSRRFFNSDAEQLFHDLFHDVESLLYKDGVENDHSVVKEIPEGFVIYRGQPCHEERNLGSVFQDPYKEIGPPPPHKARAGRMNAEGIVILGGSVDKETCLAELRPALGGETAVIALRTTKELRILDFTQIQSAHASLNYFQSDFEDQRERISFLQQLGSLISQPIAPGHEAGYLITQAMIEYLSHIHENPFDGVLFHSAQLNGGKNIALFAELQDGQPIFPIDYVDGSLTIHETTSIKYEHEEVQYSLNGKSFRKLPNYAAQLAKYAASRES